MARSKTNNYKSERVPLICNPIPLELEQKSAEWYAARLGVITASSCEKIMSPYQRSTYLYQLLAEQFLQKSEDIPVNEHMQWGIDNEQSARDMYASKTDLPVTECGFMYLNPDKTVGCSPDGLVGKYGLLEIKCPMTKTHLSYVEEGPPKKYLLQMHFQMFVTGRSWCDFVTFDPRLLDANPEIAYKCTRVPRDEVAISEINSAVSDTLYKVQQFYRNHIRK